MPTEKLLSAELRELAGRKLVLMERESTVRKKDAVSLRMSGYTDLSYLISDIVKTCVLALENLDASAAVSEPETNIAGVLSIILDLLPYEEFELLDAIRDTLLEHPDSGAAMSGTDLFLEQFTLVRPSSLPPS